MCMCMCGVCMRACLPACLHSCVPECVHDISVFLLMIHHMDTGGSKVTNNII